MCDFLVFGSGQSNNDDNDDYDSLKKIAWKEKSYGAVVLSRCKVWWYETEWYKDVMIVWLLTHGAFQCASEIW